MARSEKRFHQWPITHKNFDTYKRELQGSGGAHPEVNITSLP